MAEMTLAEFRALRKKAGICRDCGKEDAYTMIGRTYCFDCAEKQRLAKAKARKDPEKRQKMLDQHKAMTDRYESEHRCKTCGKKLSENYKYKNCERCRAKYRRALKKSREKIYGTPNERGQNNICWQCNKNIVMKGKKICAECYSWKIPVCLANLEKSRENNPWKGSFVYGKASQK